MDGKAIIRLSLAKGSNGSSLMNTSSEPIVDLGFKLSSPSNQHAQLADGSGPMADSVSAADTAVGPVKSSQWSWQLARPDSGEEAHSFAPIRKRAAQICESFSRIFNERKAELQADRRRWEDRLEERLWVAACWRDYRLQCVRQAFEAEVEQIEKEFEHDKTILKDKLLGDLLEQRKKLIDAKDRLQGYTGSGMMTLGDSASGAAGNAGAIEGLSSAAVARRMRSKRGADPSNDKGGSGVSTMGGGSGGGIGGSAGSRRRQATSTTSNGLGISTILPEVDLQEDLQLILKDGPPQQSAQPSAASGRKTQRTSSRHSSLNNGNNHHNSTEEDEEEADERDSLKHTVGSTMPTSKPDVYLSDRDAILNVANQAFSKGDSIAITGIDSDADIKGTISSLGQREMWIRAGEGSARLKITYRQLRTGQYQIARSDN